MKYKLDDPILSPAEDKLIRNEFAKSLCDAILNSPQQRGYVISLTGEWGYGKTSVLRLVEYHLSETANEIQFIEFNPWTIHEKNLIIPAFLERFQSIKLNGKWYKNLKFRMKVRKYGRILAPHLPSLLNIYPPITSGPTEAISKIIDALIQSRTTESRQLKIKRAISERLLENNKKIVVHIDDIDRLDIEEIEEVSRLVRLIADFPHVIFVLTFDPEVVMNSLDRKYSSGRDYLEKIVQQTIHLPEISPDALREYLTEGLNELLVEMKDEVYFSNDHWSELYWNVVESRIKNVRDVKRLLNSLKFTCIRIGNKVDIADLISLEALRLFDNQVFEGVLTLTEYLHKPSWGMAAGSYQSSGLDPKAKMQATLDPELYLRVEPVILELFPASASIISRKSWAEDPSGDWHLQRRVASKDLFDLYRTNVASKVLANRLRAENIFQNILDGNQISNELKQLSGEDLTSTINSLSMFSGKFPITLVPDVITAVLESNGRMQVENSGLFSLDATSVIRKVVTSILMGIEDSKDLEEVILKIAESNLSISDQNIFTYVITGNSFLNLLGEDLRNRLKSDLEAIVMATPVSDLLSERDFMSILFSVPDYLSLHLDDARLMTQVFIKSIGIGKSKEIGRNKIWEFKAAHWPGLVRLFKSESLATERLLKLLSSEEINPEDREVLLWIREQSTKGDD